MTENKGWIKPGEVRNPGGRPPKTRALTAILEAEGAKAIDVDGARVARKRLIARLTWELMTTGRATFPDGTVMQASPKDWLETVRWTYGHIDGAAKQTIDLGNARGAPFRVEQNGNSDPNSVADILRVLAEAGVFNATTGEIDSATNDAVHEPGADPEASSVSTGAES